MSDCERCNGDGEIAGEVETLQCPHCRDVCQWCNTEYDDGEPLGETGLSVCRPCIRDMAAYKEDVAWQLAVTVGIENVVDDPAKLRDALDSAIADVLELHGVNTDSVPDEWEVRN